MSRQLISHSEDLRRLSEDGYNVDISDGYLMIHDVPYVGSDRKVRRATLASSLTLAGDRTAPPDTHVAFFTGDHPCNVDGIEIAQIKHQKSDMTIRKGMVTKYSFSNKPAAGYPNYFEKMTQYIKIISNPAASIDPTATAQTKPIATDNSEETVFNYLDTASSRAGINSISNKLRELKLAIIGLGGTGAYVLDLVAKTPVAEIHLFDADVFYTHNAFRAPGAPSLEELRESPKKVQYFASLYGKMRKRIFPHECNLSETNQDELKNFQFVFVCIDDGDSKRAIVKALKERGTRFVDVGMGVQVVDELDMLIATVRVTTGTERKSDHTDKRIPFTAPQADQAYARNIQIADLNALNAVLAVVKWKKLCGVYQDLEDEHHSTYSTNVNALTNDETPCGT
jgi:hypothetical protein